MCRRPGIVIAMIVIVTFIVIVIVIVIVVISYRIVSLSHRTEMITITQPVAIVSLVSLQCLSRSHFFVFFFLSFRPSFAFLLYCFFCSLSPFPHNRAYLRAANITCVSCCPRRPRPRAPSSTRPPRCRNSRRLRSIRRTLRHGGQMSQS
jgi:hypothetical protein